MTELLTTAEVARELRKCTRFVQTEIRSGRLPACRIGQQYRVCRTDLEDYVKSQRVRVRPIVLRPRPAGPELIEQARRMAWEGR